MESHDFQPYYFSLFCETWNPLSACGPSSVDPRFIMQIFLISSPFCSAATDMTDVTVYACLFTHVHFYLIAERTNCLLRMFTKSPFALLLFISYSSLIYPFTTCCHCRYRPLSPSGMTTTNLVYWYLAVASSCIILTNCSELSYTVFSLSVPGARGFTDGVRVCVRILIWLSLYKSFLLVVGALEEKGPAPDALLRSFPIRPVQRVV